MSLIWRPTKNSLKKAHSISLYVNLVDCINIVRHWSSFNELRIILQNSFGEKMIANMQESNEEEVKDSKSKTENNTTCPDKAENITDMYRKQN